MKNTQLDIIESYPYKDYILIPIQKEVSKLFESNKIQFQMSIIDNELRLTGPKIKAKLDPSDNHTLAKIEVV